MNEDVRNAINGAKKIIDIYINGNLQYQNKFDGYQQAYFTTNEKIGSYLNIYDIHGKENALTVTAGGDHAFNLITEGIYDIDTFDLNKLTEYLAFGLRLSMIIKYNYQEYLETIKKLLDDNTSNIEVSSIIYDLLPLMDEKYRLFWSEILDYNLKQQCEKNMDKNLIDILFIGIKKVKTIEFNNNYLISEDFYNRLKNNIGKANMTFTYADAHNLHNIFNKKEYDLVLLSNILGYFSDVYGIDWKYDKLEEYLNKIKQIVKDDGIIYIYYVFIYEWTNFYRKNIKQNIIHNSCIKLEDLKNESLHKFNTEHDIINDAMLLLKVKK